MHSRTWGWSSLVTVVAAIVGVSVAIAQEERQAVNESETEQAGQAYRAKSVLGSKVSIEDDMAIGTVDDIVFTDEGYLEYLIVLNEKKLVTVPWEAAKFNFEKRTAVVSITPEKYKAIPTYTVDQYPVFSAPEYRVQTYRYYGLTPGQERRAIRRGLVRP